MVVAGGRGGRVVAVGVGGGTRALAGAVPGAAETQGAAAGGDVLPQGPGPARRAQKHRAAGRPGGAGRHPAAAPPRLGTPPGTPRRWSMSWRGRPTGLVGGDPTRCWSWTTRP